MPSSLLAQWPFIHQLLRNAPRPAGRVLDVGPGHGKASVLLPEYVPTVEAIDAVEPCAEYVDDFQLKQKYREVHERRFDQMGELMLDRYDTILMIDVIEHMEKSEALAAVERCRGQVVVCTPCKFEEAWEPGMPVYEHHVSLWHPWDFKDSAHEMEEIIERNEGWIFRLGPRQEK